MQEYVRASDYEPIYLVLQNWCRKELYHNVQKKYLKLSLSLNLKHLLFLILGLTIHTEITRVGIVR